MMQAIIVGRNRVEICPLKKKDYEKWFFQHRGQTYLIIPENLVKLRYYDSKGLECKEPEEVIVFREGASVPYDIRPGCELAYYQDSVLAAIDIEKNTRKMKTKGQGILQSATNAMNALYPIIGLLITVAVVGYAFLTGGS